ncbi:Pr6Pr family membrane protein [Nonomuraea harbinensis]|uniref:Pr6Pr family membrane protein n=1 Tax=Nonomuraea harbinensis TaxID=1286938 RepID=A0ABW1C4K4_9ACTN|nr:Pr6Pr family membrane protein [Nonomuraea harbinensis]
MATTWRAGLVLAAVTGITCLAVSIRHPWAFFTVQSNAVAALYYTWRLFGRRTSGDLKGAVTVYLVATCAVHAVSRAGENPLELIGDNPRLMGNLLLHYVTPVMAVADWLAFDRDRPARWAAPVAWLAFPVAYGIFVLLRAPWLPEGTARRYVYPYLNVDRIGWDGFALIAGALLAAIAVAGYALVWLHRMVGAYRSGTHG